jgi:hypothetical protein
MKKKETETAAARKAYDEQQWDKIKRCTAKR